MIMDMQQFSEMLHSDDDGCLICGVGPPFIKSLRALLDVEPEQVHDDRADWSPLGVWSGWSM